MDIPVGYAQVTHIFEGVGLPRGAAVTYGIQLNGGSWDPGDAAILHDIWADTFLTGQSISLSLTRTKLKAGPNDTGPYQEFAQTLPGLAAATMAPPNTAYLVRKITALGGRRNRGRFYIPGVLEGDIAAGGVLDSTRRAGMQTVSNTFMTRLAAEVLTPVILHDDNGVPTAINSLIVDERVATQRRRLR